MDDSVPDDLHQKYLAPLVLGLTTATWIEALIQAVSHGAIVPPDALAQSYLTVMGGYVVGIEVQKWKQAAPADPADDPLIERAQRSGVILWLWWVLYLGVHFWRYNDIGVPMPANLPVITMGITLLFIGKRVSRHVRHTQRGVGGSPIEAEDSANDPSQTAEDVRSVLSGSPNGMTLQELEDASSELSRPTIVRSLRDLLQSKLVVRDGKPRTRDARYRIVGK